MGIGPAAGLSAPSGRLQSILHCQMFQGRGDDATQDCLSRLAVAITSHWHCVSALGVMVGSTFCMMLQRGAPQALSIACSDPRRTCCESMPGGSAKRPSIELTAVASGELSAVLRRRQRSSELPPLLGSDGGSGRDAPAGPPSSADRGDACSWS